MKLKYSNRKIQKKNIQEKLKEIKIKKVSNKLIKKENKTIINIQFKKYFLYIVFS